MAVAYGSDALADDASEASSLSMMMIQSEHFSAKKQQQKKFYFLVEPDCQILATVTCSVEIAD